MTKASNGSFETRSISFETKALEEAGTFSGYAAVFGNVDNGGDVIVRGAFAASLNEWKVKGKLPKMLWGHDPDQPIGIWTLMREDDHGLYVEGKLFVDEVQKAREVYALLKAGAVDGLSIGYRTTDSEREDSGVRRIKEVELWEVSVVSFPMNSVANVTGIKNFNPRTLERALKEEGNLSSKDAVMVIGVLKKHLQSESEEPLSAADRDGSGAMDELLACIKSTKASLRITT